VSEAGRLAQFFVGGRHGIVLAMLDLFSRFSDLGIQSEERHKAAHHKSIISALGSIPKSYRRIAGSFLSEPSPRIVSTAIRLDSLESFTFSRFTSCGPKARRVGRASSCLTPEAAATRSP
jgi:hypothetical protein